MLRSYLTTIQKKISEKNGHEIGVFRDHFFSEIFFRGGYLSPITDFIGKKFKNQI